jgi:hypothetical protein
MTPVDISRICALAACTFPPGSYDKRFVRDLHSRMASKDAVTLTEKQAAYVRILAWRYRRQMPAALVPATRPADVETKRTRRVG